MTETSTIHIEKPYFYAATKHVSPWRVILAVDESGSMIDSVIHSAVMAGIFASLPTIKTDLFIFDTAVVDLTDRIEDPVETLMSVQLGEVHILLRRCATQRIKSRCLIKQLSCL